LPFIFDTKWKLIDHNKPEKNYQINQSDLYQLYAYGKKYDSCSLLLIYPESETFNEPVYFNYENQMNLTCIPWRFTDEITSLNELNLS
jgi:5-methylcytosine-specific restriction enzyme subunit McrC